MARAPIEIIERYSKPKIVCPHCKREILIDITPFKDNVGQIMADNCIKCGGKIFVGILIMAHPTIEGLAHCISLAANAVNPGNMLWTPPHK
jgi:hypothetical protein